MAPLTVVLLLIVLVVLIAVIKGLVTVPQQERCVVERLGQYHRTLDAGLHVVIPFFESVRYRHTMKEQVLDIPEQICITSDNVQVAVDGIIYIRVVDAKLASYGIDDYEFAISQLAQTTLRSELGKIDLDRTFEARASINQNVVAEVDKAAEAWGVKVLRYEIKNITPPKDILSAMEKQMRAERERRAAILASEGDRDAAINTAEGEKQRVIKESEARMTSQINAAKGEAEAILAVARATSEGLRVVGSALTVEGGDMAMQLRIAERFIPEFGKIAQKSSVVVLPGELSNLGSMITLARGLVSPRAAAGEEAVQATTNPVRISRGTEGTRTV
jgi:regulator of protease activity HflC (stomatin/prohibitin superfamily)